MNWQHSHLGANTEINKKKQRVSDWISLWITHSYSFLYPKPSIFSTWKTKCFEAMTRNNFIKHLSSYHPNPHTPFRSVVVLRLFRSCCTIGFSSFPAFSLCLLALRLRPLGGAAWSRPTLGGRVLPRSLYRLSISLLWNACSSEISFMCLMKRFRKRREKGHLHTCFHLILVLLHFHSATITVCYESQIITIAMSCCQTKQNKHHCYGLYC